MSVDNNEPAPLKWAEYVGRASTATLLSVIVIAGYLNLWVYGSTYAEMKSERDQWKEVALKAINLNDKVVGMPPPIKLDEAKAKVEEQKNELGR